MRRLVYFSMMSLDGYIAREDGSLDWVIIDEELHKYVNAQQAEMGAYLYGRRMYQLMADYWPTADQDPAAPDYIAEFSRIWRAIPKVVFSNTLDHVAWNSRLVLGDVREETMRLKAEPGEALSIGGADLASDVIRLGLVDEYYLYVNPVILGSGLRPFAALEHPLDLKLVETRRFGSGVVFLRYREAGSE